MLSLQIDSPFHRVFEFFSALFQNFNGFGIADTSEFVRDDISKAIQKTFVHKRIEKCHFLRAALQHRIDNIFDHCFRSVHIVVEIGKGHLRFNHPELCCMTLRIGNLCPEGWSECIDIAEGHGKVFRI